MYIQQAIDILKHHYQHLGNKNNTAWYSETQLIWACETVISALSERLNKERCEKEIKQVYDSAIKAMRGRIDEGDNF